MAIVLTQAGGAGAHQPVKLGFRIAHTLGPLHQCPGGTPFQRYTGALFLLDVASLVQLHGSGDGAGDGNSIQTILVAEHIALIDDVQIIVAAVAAIGPQGLVFRTADDLAIDIDHAAAGDGAAMAGTGLDQVFLSQSFAGDIVTLVVIAFLPVLGGESTDVVDNVHENSGTQLPQAGTGNGVGLQNIHSVFGCHLQGI